MLELIIKDDDKKIPLRYDVFINNEFYQSFYVKGPEKHLEDYYVSNGIYRIRTNESNLSNASYMAHECAVRLAKLKINNHDKEYLFKGELRDFSKPPKYVKEPYEKLEERRERIAI